jgi:hypothetical protein
MAELSSSGGLEKGAGLMTASGSDPSPCLIRPRKAGSNTRLVLLGALCEFSCWNFKGNPTKSLSLFHST